ncbi:MAG: NADH-quinone oxidoreductase subunit NuoF [Acidobacteriota bacterium]
MEKILSRNFHNPEARKIDFYTRNGGYQTLERVLREWQPAAVIDEVKKSNLRGLGGAGFPAGMKWSFVPRDSTKPKYLVVNADEGEPGTFKDRYIMEWDPHMLLEGMAICSYAVGIHTAYIYIRGEYVRQIAILEQAIAEAYEKQFLGKNILGTDFHLDVHIHRGAGAYICGEETGLLESLEGKKGWPRLKPPFPAVVGVFGCPTVINNVETLAHVPAILRNGGEWFAALGSPKNGGTRLYSISGHVERPGLYELPMGTPLRSMIYEHAGGIRGGKKLKAVIPGGASASILTADEIDIPMDFDSLAKAGSMLGSAGVVIMDEDTCMVRALSVLSRFYAHESCGQCTPCRQGTGWLEQILDRILQGEGTESDLKNLISISKNIMGNTICALGDAAALPVISYTTKFMSEFEHHVKHGRCLVA